MAKKLRHVATAGGRTIYLFGETSKIQEFFPTADVVDEEESTVKTVLFRGGMRRRFPGGPTYSTGGGTRTVVVGKPAKQATLPGNPIKCEVETGIGPLRKVDVTQFTLQGSFTAATVVARATATKNFILRSPNGKPHAINGIAGP